MVVQTDLHALLGGQTLKACYSLRRHAATLLFASRFLIRRESVFQPLNAAALLRAANHFRPHRLQEIHVVHKFVNGFFPLPVGKGAEPGIANLNARGYQHRREPPDRVDICCRLRCR